MSAFWNQKMKTFFTRIDFDHDGAITQNDFEGMAKRFIEKEKLDCNKGKELHDKLIQLWTKYFAECGHGNKITLDVFTCEMNKKVHDPALKAVLGGPLPLFFCAVDANQDGNIQADEYALFFEILGLDPHLAKDSFAAIDTNHDGMLSLDEFVTAGIDFFTSEDESKPTKLFWGPLV